MAAGELRRVASQQSAREMNAQRFFEMDAGSFAEQCAAEVGGLIKRMFPVDAQSKTPIATSISVPFREACRAVADNARFCSRLGSSGRSAQTIQKFPEGSSTWARDKLFEAKANRYIFAATARSKKVWLDKTRWHCVLCGEPISKLSHLGWWDHVNRHHWIALTAAYQRSWNAKQVLLTAERIIPLPRRSSILQSDSVSVFEATRVAQIKALIWHLLAHRQLSAFSDSLTRTSMAVEGERCFRAVVSSTCLRSMPPMSSECMTRFQQKCWGRKNLERLYDALELGRLLEEYSQCKPEESKDGKGEVMRALLYELFTLRQSGDVLVSLVAELTLQRSAQELIGFASKDLCQETSVMTERLKYPTYDEIASSGYF
jgi:hypothetical protein